jgi:Phosphotransferase enzyme family
MNKSSNSIVIIHEEFVEKFSDDPYRLATKYKEIHQLSREFSFSAPHVIDVKSDRIILERLKDITPIRDFYICHQSNSIDHLLWKAGDVLARLHAGLRKDLTTPWEPTDLFNHYAQIYLGYTLDIKKLPHGVLHCDYSFANLFVQPDEAKRIAVIDPCANFGSTFTDWSIGPIYVDLGKMLSCLEGQVPARYQLQRPPRKRIDAMQRAFLDGYEEAAGLKLDMPTAHAFAYAAGCVQFRRRYGALGLVHATFLFNRFRRNFPASSRFNGT